ncbi:MAG TPA: LytTR family DNA-binding domain-containing protein [Polyangiaceae bacterium]|nr:LytTR family DNA-binding domain-containing protein [Polyangiaceae bacterium]
MPEPFRVLVVDDEPLAREGVRSLCEADPELSVVGEAASGAGAARAIADLRPDLVFFDVEMPAGDAFDALARVEPAARPLFVFVTAHEHYARRAFDVRAVDYLLKPFTDARFAEALARAKEALSAARRRAPLAVRESGRVRYVDPGAIDWVEAADYYVELHVGGSSLLYRESMQALEGRLDPARFVRIHRKAIVNLDRVVEVVRAGRQWQVVLADGVRLPVSDRARERLRGRLGSV